MTPQLKNALRARAHSLKPVVITGQAGVSEAVLAEIDNALNHHELIKVRLRMDDRDQRKLEAEEICAKLGAELVQSMGQIVTLYRKSPEQPAKPKPKPRPRMAGPKPAARNRPRQGR